MNWFKSFSLSGSALVLVAGLLATEGWELGRERQQARRALAALEQRKQERLQFSRKLPALSKESEQAIGREIAASQDYLAGLRASLSDGGNGLVAVPPPTTALEAYFDLAAFVERARQLALDAQVLIRPDERFAFGSHRRQGPETALVPAVFRQRQRLEYLVGTLIAARPQALLAMQRERPRIGRQPGSRNPADHEGGVSAAGTGSGPEDDFLVFDGRLSLRLPGQVECDAFRLEFTGQTHSLRTFLNRLAVSQQPYFVRCVEAEPLGLGAPVGSSSSPAGGGPVPLVAQNFSRFAVVVEYLELAPVTEKLTP